MRRVTGRGIGFPNVSRRRAAPARVQTCPGERAADDSAVNEQKLVSDLFMEGPELRGENQS